MKRLQNAILSLALFLAMLLTLAGCLISEREEYHLTLNADGKSGTLVFTKYDVQSSADDSTGRQKDFQELMHNWKSDQYLLDQMNRGAYVRERDIHLENGKVVWREVSIFSDVTRLFPPIQSGNNADTIRIPYDTTENEIATTNGTVMAAGDSVVIIWPPGTKDFTITTTAKKFSPASHFEQRFARYLEQEKER